MHGLEAEWDGQVDFVYLDIDDPATEPFKRQLGYRVQPHMFLVDVDGQVLQQWLGFVDAATLEVALEQATG
ncbi:MAG: Thioredoxin [Anaerolineales bacterium]|nr:Thioredoxin [Anaerolineales bacterium]